MFTRNADIGTLLATSNVEITAINQQSSKRRVHNGVLQYMNNCNWYEFFVNGKRGKLWRILELI